MLNGEVRHDICIFICIIHNIAIYHLHFREILEHFNQVQVLIGINGITLFWQENEIFIRYIKIRFLYLHMNLHDHWFQMQHGWFEIDIAMTDMFHEYLMKLLLKQKHEHNKKYQNIMIIWNNKKKHRSFGAFLFILSCCNISRLLRPSTIFYKQELRQYIMWIFVNLMFTFKFLITYPNLNLMFTFNMVNILFNL